MRRRDVCRTVPGPSRVAFRDQSRFPGITIVSDDESDPFKLARMRKVHDPRIPSHHPSPVAREGKLELNLLLKAH
jgi:hypothetical protein